MMIIYLVLIFVFSYALAITFPVIYSKAKQSAIKQSAELQIENDEANKYPVLATAMFLIPLLVFILSEDMLLSVFCFLLAIVAYTDASARWIPDVVIYLLLAVSIISIPSNNLVFSLSAAVFYVMPAAMLSAYGYVVRKDSWIASGDYYVFPSIGLMTLPEHAAGLMLMTLAIAVLLTRRIKKIPLVTVAYFTFTGYQTCVLSGLF
ncbi:prepilin peptidase [Buttiauxella agrestis]